MNICALSIIALLTPYKISGTCKWTDFIRVSVGHYQIKNMVPFEACAVFNSSSKVNAFVKWDKNMVAVQIKEDCKLQDKNLCLNVESNFYLQCVTK